VADSGACVWFTGLSGSGKSTTAEALVPLLQEQHREVTVLDGDVVRTHLSKGLGFNREDRDTNVRRVGYVASEVVRHGGLVVAALVSPYRATREEARSMVGAGRFVEVFVDTPLDVVEQRDVKGWYAKARAGEVKDFTGVDDPYEPPPSPELTLQTLDTTPQANAALVFQYLGERGFVDLA
jgi:sulfate adenylyltransferase